MDAVTYQEEALATVQAELGPLLKAHYAEIAQDKDSMPLDPAWETYITLAREGKLSIVTARCNGQLIGYCVNFVGTHLHYQSTLCAQNDLYYVAPEYRHAHVGIELFRATEAILRAKGVQKLFAGMKTYKLVPGFFEALGWRETEIQYTKWIGD